MKTDNFENSKPKLAGNLKFMPEFISGYEKVKELLKSNTVENITVEFNSRYPLGFGNQYFKGMSEYFYAKGELAAILDNL